MPKYTVGVTEVIEYLVPVIADNENDAKEAAEEMFLDGEKSNYIVSILNREIDGVNLETETVEHDGPDAKSDDDDRRRHLHVTGNWGELICDPVTGNVIRYDRGGDWEKEGDGYDNITRLDADEWRKTYPRGNITSGTDILDFGSWDKDGVYCEAEWDWRFRLWMDRPDIVAEIGDEAKARYRAWLEEQKGDGHATEALDLLNSGGR